MPSQKRLRENRRANPGQRHALDAARLERDRELRKLSTNLAPKIQQLEESLRIGRRKVWAAYDERCALIRKATILASGSE